MKHTTRVLSKLVLVGFLTSAAIIPGLSTAKEKGHANSTDSGKLTKLANLTPAQANIVTVSGMCYTTKEATYSVTATSRESAYPKCPDNYVIQKVNLKTEQTFLDVVTKVSVVCCPQKTTWNKLS